MSAQAALEARSYFDEKNCVRFRVSLSDRIAVSGRRSAEDGCRDLPDRAGSAHGVSRSDCEIRRSQSRGRSPAAATLRSQRRRELGFHVHSAGRDTT